MKDKKQSGALVLITGPMFSGKTSRLIQLLEREQYAGNTLELFKPMLDKRYSNTEVVTHKGEKLPAVTIPTNAEGIKMLEDIADKVDVIGIDEAQFWPPELDLPEKLDQLAFKGKMVFVSILNKDHRGLPFNNTLELLARADTIHSLTAICRKCGNEATFSQRVHEGVEIFGDKVQIGGKESYEPRCRSCFIKNGHQL